ncbi:IS4 family transposase [bacterium]|nr:IS4 family transposase [bacterium]
MSIEKTVFAQIMDFYPTYEFSKCVERYQGNHGYKKFSSRDQFLCMAFAQLTYRESLRDIETCLRSMKNKLYHMGIKGNVCRSTLAYANEKRDWRIYADFAQTLIHQARDLYANEDFGVELKETVYALDASTIDLCLTLFPWAKFREEKGAIKLHTVLDLRGNIPVFIHISDGKVHDVNVLDLLRPDPGSIYVADRAYLDFKRLYRIDQAQAFFITRLKSNTKYRRVYSRPVDKSTGLRCDQTIKLSSSDSLKEYPDHLRRVVFFDEGKQRQFDYLTNNFSLSALSIANLYRCRWQVELFFKWIKQHLRIKAFYGTTANAVKTQIWIAISVYVLVAIMKKKLQLEYTLYTILQILSVTIFEKRPIGQVLSECEIPNPKDKTDWEMYLFDWKI